MTRIALIARGDNALAGALRTALAPLPAGREFLRVDTRALSFPDDLTPAETTCVYIPSSADRTGMVPDLAEAEAVFKRVVALRTVKLVLLSSAMIYGTGPARQSLVAEDYSGSSAGSDPIAGAWRSLEELAGKIVRGKVLLAILRPVSVSSSRALLSRRLASPITVTLAGHDPVLQLLSLSDLARAIVCAVELDHEGTFNVAPDGVVPLHAAVRLAHGHRFALPRTLQRMVASSASLEYMRYPWTVSNGKARRELGFIPAKSSVAALRELRNASPGATAPEPEFDEFGMDKGYVDSLGRKLFRFLRRRYWRIETRGLEHLPAQGPAVLVGMHRGFIPWDAVMALHLIASEKHRYVRFLTHPGLFKFPFISSFVRRLGGVVACQPSADRVLEDNHMLGVFPEGVRGAFSLCRDAYTLLPFGRDSFVKLALRHRAPVVPFVTIGSAEIFPILARIKSRRWTRYSDWPFLPFSTFPFLPVPLPSKWHIQFLPPIHLHEQYPPEAAQDAATVKAISAEVRARMQSAVNEMLLRRRSIFFGSVFASVKSESARSESAKSSGSR